MKEPLFIPISKTEMKLRTKLKMCFTTLEEDESPSLEDIGLMVLVGGFVVWAVLLGISVMASNL